MTESIEGITSADYHRSGKDQFSSMRASTRNHMSAVRATPEDEYDLKHAHVLRTIQHGAEPSPTLEVSQNSTNQTLQMRKLISKMQTRMEEEMADKFYEMDRKIKCNLSILYPKSFHSLLDCLH